MTASILIVDDEPDILELVSTRLRMAGYQPVPVDEATEALRTFFTVRPDLALLDIDMPGISGLEICDRIREVSDIPVLFLTAMGSESDRIRGLQSGADDYIVKPFSKEELIARIQAALRRASMPSVQSGSRDVYEDGVLTIDQQAHLVTVNGTPTSLSPLEYRMLVALVRHSGQVLSHEQLLEMAWGSNANGTSSESVRLYISYLRGKLEANPRKPRLIETVREFGYRYVRPSQANAAVAA